MRQQAQTVEELPSSETRNRRHLTSRSMVRMRLPKRFWKADFARIIEGKHRKAIGNYVANIGIALARGYGMILWGPNGTGKTAASVVCLKEARRNGATGLFITANQFISDTISRAPFDDAHTVHQRCKMVDLLVLDDLGKENYAYDASKDTVESMFEDLLRHRSANMKSTIITMNVGPDKIEERYGKSFTRVMQESNPFVEMVGPSQRETGKKELVRFFNG